MNEPIEELENSLIELCDNANLSELDSLSGSLDYDALLTDMLLACENEVVQPSEIDESKAIPTELQDEKLNSNAKQNIQRCISASTPDEISPEDEKVNNDNFASNVYPSEEVELLSDYGVGDFTEKLPGAITTIKLPFNKAKGKKKTVKKHNHSKSLSIKIWNNNIQSLQSDTSGTRCKNIHKEGDTCLKKPPMKGYVSGHRSSVSNAQTCKKLFDYDISVEFGKGNKKRSFKKKCNNSLICLDSEKATDGKHEADVEKWNEKKKTSSHFNTFSFAPEKLPLTFPSPFKLPTFVLGNGTVEANKKNTTTCFYKQTFVSNHRSRNVRNFCPEKTSRSNDHMNSNLQITFEETLEVTNTFSSLNEIQKFEKFFHN